MKDKLSLMQAESRKEEQGEVELRLEKTHLAASLFDQAGTCAAAVRVHVTCRCRTEETKKNGCQRLVV